MKIAIKEILSKIINISFRLVFVLLFVSCSFYKPDNAYVRLQAYEDSLYSECLKDSAEFDKCGFYSIFNDNSFVELLKSDTSSLSYPFEKLQEVGCVYTNTSEDGLFKIYEWNNPQFTTRWGEIKYICQYRTKSGDVQIVDDLFGLLEMSGDNDEILGEGLNRISELCSIVEKDGNTIYVLDFYGRADTQYGNHLIAVFCIGEDSLEEYKAFEGGKSYLYVEYGGISDWNSRTGGLGWEWVNSYDKENRAIYIPHLLESDIMTDRYNVYQFDGKIFRNTRTDGGFWITPKLRDFVELKTIFRTRDYLVRVDAVGDALYRLLNFRK